MISRARLGPARSARRWIFFSNVVVPINASTWPKRADAAAHIRSQASASSSPAARHNPCTATRVGNGNYSRSAISCRWLVKRSRASLAVLPSKTLTSAPPEKILPSARTRSARSEDCLTVVTAARRSSITSPLNRLSGGFASVRMPNGPEISKRTLSIHNLLQCVPPCSLGKQRDNVRRVNDCDHCASDRSASACSTASIFFQAWLHINLICRRDDRQWSLSKRVGWAGTRKSSARSGSLFNRTVLGSLGLLRLLRRRLF